MVSLGPYDDECLEIKRICEKHGYGNVMVEWASALWRRE